MPSVLAVAYDTTTGRYLVQQLGSAQIADLAITSGKLAAGAVGTADRIADAIVTSAKLTATLIASILAGVADGGIISSKIASGIVGSVHLADEAVASGDIKANSIATPHILDGGVLSASIGANSIGGGHILDGSISESELASGISIDIAELEQEPTFKAGAVISAYQAIQFTPAISGGRHFDFAQAGNISSMPALGITVAAIAASGSVGIFQHKGRITCPGWDFSGYAGSVVYVGTSSEITLMVSGLMVSGKCVQRMGKVVDPDTVFLSPDMSFAQIAQ